MEPTAYVTLADVVSYPCGPKAQGVFGYVLRLPGGTELDLFVAPADDDADRNAVLRVRDSYLPPILVTVPLALQAAYLEPIAPGAGPRAAAARQDCPHSYGAGRAAGCLPCYWARWVERAHALGVTEAELEAEPAPGVDP
jgi:hypothetical protein